MRGLQDYGGLLLGTRLKRTSEALYAGVDEVYRAHGVELPSRCFPILFLLRDNGPMGITALARELGQSHPAVSQMSRTLLDHAVVTEQEDATDQRRRLLALSSAGVALMERMGSIWQAITRAVDELAADTKVDFLAALSAFDGALQQRGFASRVGDRLRLRERRAVEIIPFESRYRDDFKRLNVEWLEKYFYVEAHDVEVLSHPEEAILKPGGAIFLARLRGAQKAETGDESNGADIVGTCALINAGRGQMELAKMAVTERCQGLGIGKRLLTAAIDHFRKSGGRELFLQSSSKLKPALALYQAHGFAHAQRPSTAIAEYQRSDVYMVYARPRDRG